MSHIASRNEQLRPELEQLEVAMALNPPRTPLELLEEGSAAQLPPLQYLDGLLGREFKSAEQAKSELGEAKAILMTMLFDIDSLHKYACQLVSEKVC